MVPACGLTSRRDRECEDPLGHEYQTDHVTEHRRLDIVVIDKDNKRALLIDIAVPADARVKRKGAGKDG